jgi:hypothetical protein
LCDTNSQSMGKRRAITAIEPIKCGIVFVADSLGRFDCQLPRPRFHIGYIGSVSNWRASRILVDLVREPRAYGATARRYACLPECKDFLSFRWLYFHSLLTQCEGSHRSLFGNHDTRISGPWIASSVHIVRRTDEFRAGDQPNIGSNGRALVEGARSALAYNLLQPLIFAFKVSSAIIRSAAAESAGQ